MIPTLGLTASAAFAFSTGFTPEPSPSELAFDCGQCHNQTGNFLDVAPPEARPTITAALVGGDVEGSIDDPLVLDEPRALRVRVDSALTGADRALGISLAVVSLDAASGIDRAAALVSLDGALQSTRLDNGDLTHRAPIVWSDGSVALDIELTPIEAGDLALYVVANDVDGDGEPGAGDFVWSQHVCFTVDASNDLDRTPCDAELQWVEADSLADDERDADEVRGCATVPTGGSMIWLLAFAATRRFGRSNGASEGGDS